MSTALDKRLPAPVFVVGCCNSGTTILWQALKAHPAFDGPECEGQDLPDLPSPMKHFLGRRTFRLFAHPRFRLAYRLTERDREKKLAERVAAVYSEHVAAGKRFIEKSPANSLRTRFLQSVFPDATFVIIARNGLAVSEGIVRKRLYDPERPHLGGQRTTLTEAAFQWSISNRILLLDRRYLQRSIMVTYDEVVSDTARTVSRILKYCGAEEPLTTLPRFEQDHDERQIARLSADEKHLIKTVDPTLFTQLRYQLRRTTE